MSETDGYLYHSKTKGRWYAVLEWPPDPATGKRRRRRASASTRGAAQRLLRQLREDRDAATISTSGVQTVDDLLSLWYTRRAPETMSPSTLASAGASVRALTAALGHVDAKALTTEQVEAMLQGQADLGRARSTLQKHRNYLSQAYSFAISRRLVEWNPAEAAILPRSAGVNRPARALSAEELKALMAAAENHRLGAWVTVTGTLGLRPGEASGLEWPDVDLEAGTVTIHQSLSWVQGQPEMKQTKTGTVRVLGMPQRAVDALTVHQQTQAMEAEAAGSRWPGQWSQLVFKTETGTPLDPSNLRRLVAQIAEEADVGKVSPKDLRHTATTLLAELGVPADQLADFLGHSDTRMVWAHYRHRTGRTFVLPDGFGA